MADKAEFKELDGQSKDIYSRRKRKSQSGISEVF